MYSSNGHIRGLLNSKLSVSNYFLKLIPTYLLFNFMISPTMKAWCFANFKIQVKWHHYGSVINEWIKNYSVGENIWTGGGNLDESGCFRKKLVYFCWVRLNWYCQTCMLLRDKRATVNINISNINIDISNIQKWKVNCVTVT